MYAIRSYYAFYSTIIRISSVSIVWFASTQIFLTTPPWGARKVRIIFVITSYSIHYTKLYDQRAEAGDLTMRLSEERIEFINQQVIDRLFDEKLLEIA